MPQARGARHPRGAQLSLTITTLGRSGGARGALARPPPPATERNPCLMSLALVEPAGPVPRPPSNPTRRSPQAMSLPALAESCARALRAFAGSLHALEAVLQPLSQVNPSGTQAVETRAVLADAVALIQREAPSLLLRAQALRLRLHAAGLCAPDGLGTGLRLLQREIDALPETVETLGAGLPRARQVAQDLAEAFDRLAAGQPAPLPADLPEA